MDLRSFDFVTPGGLVPLSLALQQHASSGRVILVLADNPQVRGYLVRTGLFDQFDGRVAADPPLIGAEQGRFASYKGGSPLLLELTFVRSVGELPPILDKVIQVLQELLHYGQSQAFDIATVISEILQNSLEHGHADVIAPASMQVYRHQRGPRLEIALGDNGIGIRKSLSRNKKFRGLRSDQDAIMSAIEPGVSEYRDRTRGNGLRRLMDKVFEHKGTVDIRSGSGKIHFRMDRGVGWKHVVPELPGAQIIVSLPAS